MRHAAHAPTPRAGTLLFRKRTKVPDAFGLLSEEQRALGQQLLPPQAAPLAEGEEAAAAAEAEAAAESSEQ